MPLLARRTHTYRAARRRSRPLQVFIESSAGLAGEELERELFIVRKLMEKEKVRRGSCLREL